MTHPVEPTSGRLPLSEPTAGASDILEGPLRAPLLRLALPLVGGYTFQIGFGYVDAYFVAQLGKDALAAVGATMFVLWSLFSLAELITVGVMALVARAIGARRGGEASAAVLTGLVLGVGLSLTGALGGLALLPSIVGLMGIEAAPTALAADYLRVLLLGYPTLIGFLLLESAFRGAGDTRTPMLVLAGTFVLNGVLDRVLIFGLGPIPAFGVAGASAATVIARGAGCLVLLPLLWRRRAGLGLTRPGPGWLSLERCRRIVRIGAPASFAGISFCFIYVGLVRITAEFGTAVVAALGLGLRLEGLTFFLTLSLGRAAATIAGQNLGAEQPERAREVTRLAIRLGWLVMIPFALVLLVTPAPIVAIFIDDPAVIGPAALYLQVISWALFPFVTEVILDNVAAGVGDTVPAMGIELLGTALRLPVALLLIAVGFGYLGVWWCVSLTIVVKAIAFEVWFRRGRWATRAL